MLDLETIGGEVAARRKDTKLTQMQLAQRAGVSRATITLLESGATRELGFHKVMRILAVLGLDLRVTAANLGRPTLEDLRREDER